ncbi:MAG: hypothetical protein K2I88_07865 [Anaeroplasmataceae bacterium]|nr:hypothetical protein [Anaeroplasmataceae bacterium]
MKKTISFSVIILALFLGISMNVNAAEDTPTSYSTNDIEEYNVDKSVTEHSTLMEESPILVLSETPDTYVEGILEWEDEDGDNQSLGVNVHPLQYVLVELWDIHPSGRKKLGLTYTDKNGYYQFDFKKDTQLLDFSNENHNLSIELVAEGENIKVCNSNGNKYSVNIGYKENFKIGDMLNFSKIFLMTGTVKNKFANETETIDRFICHALQITQPVIYASKYVKEMYGSYIAPTTIVYPHNQSDNDPAWFDFEKRTIFIGRSTNSVYPIYSLWDMIMHEYGHHIQMGLGFDDGPGNDHYDVRMADHYMKHFKGFTEEDRSPNSNEEPQCTSCAAAKKAIKERDCKLQGNKMAWEECFPTYFAIVAQQYFAEDLMNIPNVGDSNYIGSRGWGYSLTDSRKLGEDNEGTIQSIFYEMYDDSNYDTDRDGLVLGHKTMWDLLTNSHATTFQEFDTYFRNNHSNKEELSVYGRILSYYGLAPSIATADQIDINGASFSWSYALEQDSRYYNNYSYQLNFYDSSRNLIGRSNVTERDSLSLDEYLWENVMNSGSFFYVSVTRYENSYPTTSYEGEWTRYSTPEVITLLYTSNITKSLGTGECHWYSFTAPETAHYVFKTSGDMDTYGELYHRITVGQSTNGRITYEDDIDDEDHNFMITYALNKSQTIYLRVRGFNWIGTGEYTIYMYSPNHLHGYTYSYFPKDDNYHYSYCYCGRYLEVEHKYLIEGIGRRCIVCKHYTEAPFIPITKNKNENDEVLYLEKKDILEEISS